MSISKLRGKSALVQNENTKSTTTTAIKGTTAAAVTVAGPIATASTTAIPATNTNQYHGGAHISTKSSFSTATTTTATTTTSITAAKLHNPSTANTAAAATTILQQQQQPQQTYIPQTSLLKIEPFVPSFNARIRRRPIGRSYSTLSSTCIKRGGGSVGIGIGFMGTNATHLEGKNTVSIPLCTAAAIDSTAAATATLKAISRPVGRLRRDPAKIVVRQRSKSTSSSASNHRPTTAAAGITSATINVNHTPNVTAATSTIVNGNGNSNGITAIVTPQPNGICRIARLPKEQEKLPDRINYDRRGLTAIPLFENETNLRLLSLQHNLINIFHIPKESVVVSSVTLGVTEETADQASKLSDDINCNFNSRSSNHLSRTNSIQGRTTPSNNSSTRLSLTLLATTNAGNSHILTPPATTTAVVGGSPLTMHPIPIGGSSIGAGSTSQINHQHNRNSILQKKHFNYHSSLLINTHQPHPYSHHHHQQQQTQYRFALKKSKSFITNYSRHLNHVKQNLQKTCYLTKTETSHMVAPTLSASTANINSFDSGTSGIDSTSTLLSISEMEATAEECCENMRHAAQQQQLQLEIKNKQLMASYGEIFQNLVFLDLYDNQIERIGNLDGMPSLSVLLLGKNRIGDISGLASLRDTLRVLDLHGNKITGISNKINCLQELKSLNLAGNQIRQINQNDFNGLMNLKELNLKRNKIKRINGFQHLVALERLWLCHNDLHKVEDMSSIAKAINLLEVTIENNPVSLAGDCVSFLVSYLPRLQSLSQMPITEQVRRAAMAWRKNKEISDANYSHLSSDVFNSIRREEVISNARTNWELLRSQQTVQSTLRNQRTLKQPELAKINESNETVAVGYDELQEFIKLPPIQKQQQQQQQSSQGAKHHNREGRLSDGSSGSSLGPNVDSSSSNYSSDVEESPKACGEVELTRVKKCQKPMSVRSRKEKTNKLEASRSNKKQTETQINNSSMKCESGARDLNTIRTATPLAPSAPNSTTIAAAEDAISKATEVATQQQLTLMNSNQVDNNSSIQSKSNPSITMLPQTDRPTTSSYVLRTTTTTTTTILRATTPTTQITGSSSTLSLGFKENNVCHNTTTAASTATIPQQQTSVAATTTTKATCKRYLKGSLIRSQTVVGGGGGTVIDGTGGKGNSSSSHSNVNRGANAANNNSGLQIQSHQNAATNNANGQTSGSSIVSTILAPAVSLNTSSSKTSSNSKAAAANATANSTTTEREREQGGDYLIEICGRYLNIYGQGALRYIDKQWNPAKANDVHTLNFSYINFNNIAATVLSRIKLRFPHAENFVFRETNISNLGQLNALAELQGITSLCIDPEGNAITTKDLWRQYAIYRLSHWGLKLLNGVEVTDADVEEANCMYAGLSDLVLWSMPEMMLQPLLARLRLDETCTASKMSPKEWLMKADNKSLRLVVGKEALQWKKTNDNNNNHQHYAYDSSSSGGGINGNGGGNASSLSATTSMAAMASLTVRERGKIHFSQMMLNTCNAVEKLHKLETLWPSLLLDIVRNTLLDYSQLDEYLRNLMSEIMK